MTEEKCIHFSGHINYEDGSQDRATNVRPELEYNDHTRQPTGGRVHFDLQSGNTTTIEIMSLADSPGFHLGSGFHMGSRPYNSIEGRFYPLEEGGFYEEGDHTEDVSSEDHNLRVYQLRDNIITAYHGDAEGYGFLQSIAYGVWPQLGLTNNAIYACLD